MNVTSKPKALFSAGQEGRTDKVQFFSASLSEISFAFAGRFRKWGGGTSSGGNITRLVCKWFAYRVGFPF